MSRNCHTAMDECLQSFGYFHTKMAFSRGHLQTNWFSNFLILLRVKQYIYTECPIDFCPQKNGDQIAYMSSKSKISKILKGFGQLGIGIFKIFEKYEKMKIF